MSTTSSTSPIARPTGSARWGLVQVCLAGVLWGTGGLAVQLVREHAPLSALTISGWRTGLAALALVALVLARRSARRVTGLPRAQPGQVAAVGLCTAAYQALYFGAVVAAGVTVATVVSLGLAPVLLTARDVVRARRWPGAFEAGPVVVALVGLVLVSTAPGHGAGSGGESPVLGVLLALGAGATYALATALGEPLARSHDPLVLTTATTAVGALGLVPVALVVAVVAGEPVLTADPVALGWLVYLGVLTFALAYGLLYAGLRSTSSSAAVVATLLEPVTAGVVAALVLGERIGALGVVGMVLVLLAVAGLGLRREPRSEVPEPAH